MICRNCGKEIPDDAQYCGYCGAEQTKAVDVDEEKKESEAVVPAEETSEMDKGEEVTGSDTPSSTKDEKETDDQETKPAVIEEKEADADNSKAEEVNPDHQEEKQEEVSDQTETEEAVQSESSEPEEKEETAAPESSQPVKEEQPVQEEKKKPAKQKLKEAGNKIANTAEPVIDKGKKAVHKTNWNAFHVYLDILKNPFDDHAIDKLPLWTGIVIMLLGNWFVFGSLGNGLFVLLFAFAGSMIVQYIGARGVDEYHLGHAFEKAFCSTFIPFIAVFIAGILIHSGYGNTVILTRRLGLVTVLLIFAAVMLGVSIAKSADKMNFWVLALILTAVFSAIVYYLAAQSVVQIVAAFGAF